MACTFLVLLLLYGSIGSRLNRLNNDDNLFILSKVEDSLKLARASSMPEEGGESTPRTSCMLVVLCGQESSFYYGNNAPCVPSYQKDLWPVPRSITLRGSCKHGGSDTAVPGKGVAYRGSPVGVLALYGASFPVGVRRRPTATPGETVAVTSVSNYVDYHCSLAASDYLSGTPCIYRGMLVRFFSWHSRIGLRP